MDKKFSYVFAGIFLTAVLVMSFVFAVSYDLVSSGQTAKAGNTVSLAAFNITSTTGINTNLTTITLELTGNASVGNVTSVNISDGTNDYSNGSITGTTITIDASNVNASAQGNTNLTINATLNSSATYGFAFGINITSVGVESSNVTVDVATNSSSVFVTETTNPTATATCTDIYVGDAFACTCSGTDSGATASGVSTSVGTSTSGSITDTSVTGVFTYSCSVTDVAGNSASATKQYVVFTVGGGGGSGGGASEQLPQKKHTLAKITPGVVSIVKDFDPEIGVKQITIEVNNEAQNVKITVTKYDGKPAEVSKERSGKVYQYFEVDAQNLGSKLDKAVMRAKVEKSWVSSNGLDKEDILVFKFDESAEEWKELGTVYVEEDNTFYYYDVELDSFSFFAISAKTLTEKTGETVGGVGEKITEAKKSSLFWIVLVVLIGLAVWFYLFRQKKTNP